MAEFEATVCRITIEDHPNADALEIARVGDYRSIVQKDTYKTGDLCVYIPEQAVLPSWLIEALGLVGRLAGKDKNRVKAIKLRGILSQGLIAPCVGQQSSFPDACTFAVQNETDTMGVGVDDNVTEFLSITKYEPIIPASMSGDVESAFGKTLKYDIENIKKHPDVFVPGEMVAITEKIHGTWACFGFHPDLENDIVTSKGMSARGLIFKLNDPLSSVTGRVPNENNLYVREYKQFDMEAAREYVNEYFAFQNDSLPFYVLGEIFGRGVQDLHYGQDKPAFRIFDVYVGEPGVGRYLGINEKIDFASRVGVPLVPVLYVGDYDKAIVDEYTNGKEIVSGELNPTHMREGVVVTAARERQDDELGRVILKSVSEDYLLRKGGTEYN